MPLGKMLIKEKKGQVVLLTTEKNQIKDKKCVVIEPNSAKNY